MIKPVNNHVLIEPLKHDSFVSQEKGTYEEIGVVVSCDESLTLKPGIRVYFDSWLAGKFPDGKGGYLWLVSWDDVKAIETDEKDTVSE